MKSKVFLTKSITRVFDRSEMNAKKEQLEQFFERYDFETTNLMTNLAVLKIMIEHYVEIKKYNEYAPSFMAVSWYNAWVTTVVFLCSMLKKKSEGSLFGLLDFVEMNQNQIFTKEWHEAVAPLDGSYVEDELEWTKLSFDSPNDVIAKCRTTLADKENEIKSIFVVRDKVYAHFDIISINEEQRTVILDQINYGLLERLTSLVAEVLNQLHLLYEQKFVFYEPIQADDLLKFYNPLCFYEEHIDQAIDEEWRRQMSE